MCWAQSEEARRLAARRRALESAKKEEEEEEAAATPDNGSWFASSAVGGFFQKLAGNKVLDEDDIAPVLAQMKEQLLSKNVASEVADEVCASVGTSLVGKKLDRLTRIATVVRDAMQVCAHPSTRVFISLFAFLFLILLFLHLLMW